MDFFDAISRIVKRLDAAGVNYALIGGLAMALRGAQRATFDLDFLLMLSDLPVAHAALEEEGYRRVFQSENVSHYQKDGPGLARVDILHAFRGPSLGMLTRVDRLAISADCTLPVLKIEDIIGLKIQALVNNPTRALGDWNDIHRLISHASRERQPLRWELIGDYLEIFHLENKLPELRGLYDASH